MKSIVMINLTIWCLMWNEWLFNPLKIAVTLKTNNPIIDIILKYSVPRESENKMAIPLIMLKNVA